MAKFFAGQRLRLTLPLTAIALVLSACGNDDEVNRGSIVTDTAITTLTKSQIDAAMTAAGASVLTGAAKCDVSLREVVYNTAGPDGKMYQVSSAVLVPGGTGCAGPYSVVSYNRGTEVVKARTMASATDPETGLLMGMLAAQGYVVVATDYLGFAKSNHDYHPYLHAESQASTTIDAVIAANSVLGKLGVSTNGKVFLTGYSQGGHASMATQKVLEASPALGVKVTAAGHMSGPYNLSGAFVAGLSFLPSGTGGSTVFTPYLTGGYQKIYRNLYTATTDLYKAPYATGIENLLPGTLTFNQLFTTGKLPAALGDLLTPKAIGDVTDTNSGLRKALDANTLLGWKPAAPVLLCGGSKDPVVLFAVNTTVSAQNITSLGGTVSVVDVDPFVPPSTPLDSYHGTAVPPLCLKSVRDFFNTK